MNSASQPPTDEMRKILETALAHQNAGRVDVAQQMYEEILARAHDNGDALHLLGALKFEAGGFDDALSLVRQAIAACPERADYQNTLGVIHKSLEHLEDAKSALNTAISLSPRFAEAWNNLGAVMEDEEHWEDATEAYETSLMHAPDFVQALVNVGRVHLQRERTKEAEAAYKQALEIDPGNAEALNGFGLVLEKTDRLPDAIRSFERATQANPAFRPAFNNLALLFIRLKRTRDAELTLDAALKHSPSNTPDDPQTLDAIAAVRQAQGRIDEAIDAAETAVKMRPDDADGHAALGLFQHHGGRLKAAEGSFRRALSLDPTRADARFNLAIVLQRQGRIQDAEALLNELLLHSPDDPEIFRFLGVLRRSGGDLSGAIKALEKALTLAPDNAVAIGNLAAVHQDQGRQDDAVKLYVQAIEKAPASASVHSNFLMSLNYRSDDPDKIFDAHRRWAARLESTIDSPTSPPEKTIFRHAKAPLKLGYVSGDFRRHSVAYFFEPVLEHHDRTQFEVFCYATLENPDDVTARMEKSADHWRYVSGLTDDQLAARIAEDQIDILVDLSGHTANNRLATFARKPAPVQVSWLGYPNTTGLSAMQYRLTDGIADPPGAEAHHREQLIRLPHGFLCYRAPDDAPDVAPAPHGQNGYITFGSFNNLAKVTPDVVAVWSSILNRLPNSHLLIKARPLADAMVYKNFLAQFEANGVDRARIVLRSRTSSMADHLSMYADMDIALDTFPYNGTTTTCEALWMGAPVVTLTGNRHAARVGASLLSRIDLADCVAVDIADYSNIAVKLATDQSRLVSLRERLRERLSTSVLCAPQTITSDIETAYRRMLQEAGFNGN